MSGYIALLKGKDDLSSLISILVFVMLVDFALMDVNVDSCGPSALYYSLNDRWYFLWLEGKSIRN